jgi:hypothetical protein
MVRKRNDNPPMYNPVNYLPEYDMKRSVAMDT